MSLQLCFMFQYILLQNLYAVHAPSHIYRDWLNCFRRYSFFLCMFRGYCFVDRHTQPDLTVTLLPLARVGEVSAAGSRHKLRKYISHSHT